MRVIPIMCRTRSKPFDLAKAVIEEITRNKQNLKDFDILVVSSKFAAVSEGRLVRLEKVVPTRKAKMLANLYHLSPALAQLVLEESDQIVGGITGFSLSLINGTLVPNAGIDLSNVLGGWAVLYPKNPSRTADNLRRKILKSSSHYSSKGKPLKHLGVVLSDSRITPTRVGTTGVAIAVSGIRPTIDMRGKKDLFENELKVTMRGLSDQLASAAQVLMGEANESIPVVIIRGVKAAFEIPRNESEMKMSISPQRCLIVSGLRNGFRRQIDSAYAFDTSTPKSDIESL